MFGGGLAKNLSICERSNVSLRRLISSIKSDLKKNLNSNFSILEKMVNVKK